jgi:hypothetical protein
MNFLLGVERVLLADVAKTYDELKTIDDKTIKGCKIKFFIVTPFLWQLVFDYILPFA